MQRLILTTMLLALTQAALAEQVVIACPAEPPVVRRLQLQEQWRIDPDDEDAPLMSYFDQRNLATDGERLYLLDPQLCHVLVYSRDGRYLDTIMGEGDGPGEVRMPQMLQLMPDGALAVSHGYPSCVEVVERDGTPRRRWKLWCNTWAEVIMPTPRGWFARYRENKESGEPGLFWSVQHVAFHDDDGQPTISLHAEESRHRAGDGHNRDERASYRPWSAAIPVEGGQVVRAPRRDEYRLEWIGLDGQIERVVTRPCEAHRRTEQELNELRYSSYSIIGGELIIDERDYCEHDPMIRHLEELPDGGLRVRTSRFNKDLPDGMVCRYEVHEPDGRLRERVEIFDPTGDFDPDYDALALLDDGGAVVLRNLLSAFRAIYDSRMHPDLQKVMPPAPDDREDIAFMPIVCDLVAAP